MLKDRETGDCQVAPTGPLRQFPQGVLPTRVLSRPAAASLAQSQLQLHCNCTKIAVELQDNCTRIAAKPQQLHTIAAKPYRGGGGRPATRGKSARRNCNLAQPRREAARPE